MATDLSTILSDANIANTEAYTSINQMDIYDFMDTAYYGDGGFRDGKYLVPHSREMFYKKRRDLCFYKNYVRPIVRAIVEPVFIKPASRAIVTPGGSSDPVSLFNDFIWDCDNAGTYLQSFSDDIMTTAQLHSVTFVVVDNFSSDEIPESVEEARKERRFPYVYSRKAQQVKSYKLDQFGNLESIVFIEAPVVVIASGIKVIENRYRYWDNEKTILYKEDRIKKDKLVVLSETYHNLKKIPVIVIYTARRKTTDTLLVDPFLYDIAKLNHTIFNKDSEIRELERNQGFSTFYIQSDGGNLTMETSNVLFIPMDATMPPGFVSPNPAIQAQLMDYQEKIREDLFRIAEQSGVTGVQSSKSGVAMQWDFFAHESILIKTSSLATMLEEKIAELFKLYTKEEFVYVVQYPQSFQPNDKLAEVKITDMYLSFDLPSKARAMAKEKITRLLFSGEDENRVQEAIDEIYSDAEDELHAANGSRDQDDKEAGEDSQEESEEGNS